MPSAHYVVQLETGEYLGGLIEHSNTGNAGRLAVGDRDSAMQVFQTLGQAETIANIIGNGAHVVPARVNPCLPPSALPIIDYADVELRVAAAIADGQPIPGGMSAELLTGRNPTPPVGARHGQGIHTRTPLDGEEYERGRIIKLLKDRAAAIRESGKDEAFMHPRLRGDAELRAAVLDAAIQDIYMTMRGGRFGTP